MLRKMDGYEGSFTVCYALRLCGVWESAKTKMSGHGFRAMARTILDEVLGVRPDYIEQQLAKAIAEEMRKSELTS